MRSPDRVVGTCWLCRRPVRVYEVNRVKDVAVSEAQGRRVTRLVHAGDCAQTLRARIGEARP